jgi:hypothetical protein
MFWMYAASWLLLNVPLGSQSVRFLFHIHPNKFLACNSLKITKYFRAVGIKINSRNFIKFVLVKILGIERIHMKRYSLEICHILSDAGSGPQHCRKGIPSNGMQRLRFTLLWQPLRCMLAPGGNRFSIFLEFKLLSEEHNMERTGTMIFVNRHSVAEQTVMHTWCKESALVRFCRGAVELTSDLGRCVVCRSAGKRCVVAMRQLAYKHTMRR